MTDNTSKPTVSLASRQRRTLGETIQRHRLRAGLSIRQLSKEVGVNPSYISRLERGEKSHPTSEVLQNLADAVKVEAGELLRFIGVKPGVTMPSKRVFFRQSYGLTVAQAKEAEAKVAEMIEELRIQANRNDVNN